MPSETQEKKNGLVKAETSAPTKVNGVKNDAKPSDVLLTGEDGAVLIREHVVGKIAGLAIREVAGVHGLVAFGTGEALADLAARFTGSDKRDLGVHVEIGTVECAVDCRIVADYGASLPKVASEIRESVTRRVAEMTGLVTREVNVEIVDLYFGEPQRVEEAPLRQLR